MLPSLKFSGTARRLVLKLAAPMRVGSHSINFPRLCFWTGTTGRGAGLFAPILYILALYGMSVSPTWAKPILLGHPHTARPGDVITVTGQGFGTAPKVYISIGWNEGWFEVKTSVAKKDAVVFQIPKTLPFHLYNVWISDGAGGWGNAAINAPRATHFDTPEIAPGSRFRIFGNNLYLREAGARVDLIDKQTGAWLNASIVASNSDAYNLEVIAPSGVVPGKTYDVKVSNGYWGKVAERTIAGRTGGADYFGLGLPWGADYITEDRPGDRRVLNITNDPVLSLHAKADGATDIRAALQAAIDLLAAKGGGIVYFPPGNYRLIWRHAVGVTMRSGVVIKGYSAGSTKIIFGPDANDPRDYTFQVFYWPDGTERTGLADLSLVNIDKTSKTVVNAFVKEGTKVKKLFLQRVNWDLGSGMPILLAGNDKLAILNSSFRQSINKHFPYSNGQSGVGPLYFVYASDLVFRNNKVTWPTSNMVMSDLDTALIENNHFTRSASDQIVAGKEQLSWGFAYPVKIGDVVQRSSGRQLVINFGKNVVLQGNTFDVSDGRLRTQWNDGETILSEGGAGDKYQRGDTGIVTSAGATTLSDSKKSSWTIYPNSFVALVSGKGEGQIRKIVSRSGSTLVIDKPWDIIPAAGDHFAISVPSYENAIIRHNTLKDNPAGILLYRGSFLNVSIVGNELIDNGGIWVRPDQRTNSDGRYLFSVNKNIEINDNILRNTKSQFPLYIALHFALVHPNSFWGTSTTAVEIRNNRLEARPGTPTYLVEEGYFSNAYYQNPNAKFAENGIPAIVGTVLQGNSCHNCPINYTLSTGVDSAVIWNATSTASSGVASQFLKDFKFSTASPASTNTTIGKD
jgi:hypothetical protein